MIVRSLILYITSRVTLCHTVVYIRFINSSYQIYSAVCFYENVSLFCHSTVFIFFTNPNNLLLTILWGDKCAIFRIDYDVIPKIALLLAYLLRHVNTRALSSKSTRG